MRTMNAEQQAEHDRWRQQYLNSEHHKEHLMFLKAVNGPGRVFRNTGVWRTGHPTPAQVDSSTNTHGSQVPLEE